MYNGGDLEDDSLSKGRNKKIIWAKACFLALPPQKRGRFEYWLSCENPGSPMHGECLPGPRIPENAYRICRRGMHTGHDRAWRVCANREQRHIEPSKTLPDLGERGTDGDFVLVFAGTDGPIRGVAGEEDLLVRAMEVIYDPR